LNVVQNVFLLVSHIVAIWRFDSCLQGWMLLGVWKKRGSDTVPLSFRQGGSGSARKAMISWRRSQPHEAFFVYLDWKLC